MNIYEKYQHYKTGHLYEIVGYARHSETHEEMVIYRDTFGSNALWVRPKKLFFESVMHEGKKVPRFKKMELL